MKRILLGVVGLFVGLAILGVIINAVSGHKSATLTAPTTTAAPVKAKPKPCSSFSAASRPSRCLTPAQRRARVRLAARRRADAARRTRIAAKKKAAAQAKVRAQAAAAYAAANAWHKGYRQQDDNVFWQWHQGGSCQDFATNGCWHVAVITRYGCSRYVAVNANEYQNGAIIGSLLDNQGYGIPPHTARVFELDADASGVTAGNVTVDCT